MKYLDSSVLLSEIMSEDRRPPAEFWSPPLVSSRLLMIEVLTRMQAYGVRDSYGRAALRLLEGVNIVEMDPPALARAHEPFPQAVRALDAIHLSSADFLREQGHPVEIATYDARMRSTAEAMGLTLYAWEG